MTFKRHHLLLMFGAALLAIVSLAAMMGDGPGSFDLLVLRAVASMRSSELTYIFSNVTALGSFALVVLHSLIAFALLVSTRDQRGAWQLVSASIGAWLLTQLAKFIIQRPRPTAIPALAEAAGFSYPSGHAFTATAMYVTIAILAGRHLRLPRQRAVLGVSTAIVIAAIALSRVYLGVHYPTDIIGGVLLGTGWALFLEGIFEARQKASA
jgi:undecaprenyl-diphosphatase